MLMELFEQKPRPSQLSLSPSDGALNASVKAVSGIPEETDEDRAALSEVCLHSSSMLISSHRLSTG